MDHSPRTTEAPPVIAPPTIPGYIPGQRSSWPNVLGIISIVFGVLGALGGIIQGIFVVFMPWVMGMVEQSDPSAGAQAQVIRESVGLQVLLSAATVGVAVMLLISGIGLANRRPYGVKWSRIWAVTKIVVATIGVAVGIIIQQRTFDALAESGQAPPPGGQVALGAGMAAGTVFGIAWRWAYPVFLLIWLNRASIRAEVAEWR
jgi:hypothetical protein